MAACLGFSQIFFSLSPVILLSKARVGDGGWLGIGGGGGWWAAAHPFPELALSGS